MKNLLKPVIDVVGVEVLSSRNKLPGVVRAAARRIHTDLKAQQLINNRIQLIHQSVKREMGKT